MHVPSEIFQSLNVESWDAVTANVESTDMLTECTYIVMALYGYGPI